MARNSVEISGVLVELGRVRTTPGGVAVVEGAMEHRSRTIEAGMEREISALVPFVVLGELARVIASAALGSKIGAIGFLAAKSLKSNRLVLHVTDMKFIEGYENGIQTEAP